MTQLLIRIENLSKDYVNDEVVTSVLHKLNLKIDQGEFVAIMGASGSGKSTLMHILGFLDRPSEGKYFFLSEDTSNFDDEKLAKIRNEEVGFVFQSFFLLSKTTVLENVKLPLVYSKVPDKETRAREAIKAVGLEHRLNYYSSQLSGGEKQRVAIARALVNKPQIIFADEPTGNLDSKNGTQIMEIIQRLNEQGKTIILVTHEKDTAEHAKRIIRLHDGEITDDYPVTNRKFAKDGILQK